MLCHLSFQDLAILQSLQLGAMISGLAYLHISALVIQLTCLPLLAKIGLIIVFLIENTLVLQSVVMICVTSYLQ